MVARILPVPWLTRPALLGRSQQIMSVLTRHGISWLVTHMEERVSSRRSLGLVGGEPARRQAQHLREALVELGPTFIKMGQALSTRLDLLPPAFIEELSKLQDEVPPQPFAQMREVLRAELGVEPEALFDGLEETPLASASIGQVYTARLKNGQAVILKIRRPGITDNIEHDLEILTNMADWAANHTALGPLYDLPELVNEFAYRLRNELDYVREGHNADVFRRNFYGDPGVYIPRVYWEYTSQQVLVMERVDGIKLLDLEKIHQAGINSRVVAENWGKFTLRQLFEFGFYQADPHPGNFFVLPDGSLGVVDFGMVGRLSEPMRAALLNMVLAMSRSDAEMLVDVLLDAGMTSARIRRTALAQDLAHMMENYSVTGQQLMTVSGMAKQIMEIAFRHGLQMPGDLAMLFRLVVVNEGVSQQLYPDWRMLDFAAPYVKELWTRERSPQTLWPRLGQTAMEGMELTLNLPRQISRLLKQLERGQLEFNINYDGLREFTGQMQKMTNRLALAMLLSAVIVALGLTMVVYHPVEWQRLGEYIFGFAFISSLAVGAWLIFSIFRSGRT